MTPEQIADIQQDFPFLSRELDGQSVLYLDSAATSLKPRQMVEAVNQYYLYESTNIHRGKHALGEAASNRYEQARYKLADWAGCHGNEVVMVKNTTEGLNIVANGLNLTKQDEVIVFADAHHANLLPWMENATVHIVPLNHLHQPDLNQYYDLLKRKPKVVALNHCSNVTGVYLDIQPLIAAAQQTGAITVLDAAQSAPHRKLNFADWNVDFMVFSGHKMLGPTGVGVLCGRRERLNELSVTTLGGGMVDWVDQQGYRLRKIPHRFEAGTPNIAGAYGMAAAIDYLEQLGQDAIISHEKAFSQALFYAANSRDYLEIVNPDETADRGGIITFSIPGMDNLDDLARTLSDSYAIMCRTGHLCAQPYVNAVTSGQVIRVSGYFYNQLSDVERVFSALDEVTEEFREGVFEI